MILFGTSGVPHSAPGRQTEDGVREIARLGLDGMEVEFVRGVKMTSASAERVRKAASETGVMLTAHGPYYINLASPESEKAQASIERILATARRAHEFGGRSITFHAAYYQGRDPDEIFQLVADRLRHIVGVLQKDGITLPVSPELTGKPTQFGSLEELIRLSKTVAGVRPCIDFAHYVARGAGANNSYDGFRALLTKIKKGLGAKALQQLHMHVAGIEWTGKGEKKHHPLRKSDFDWRALLAALVDLEVSGIMICESPLLEEDALLLKKEYETMIASRGRRDAPERN